jgi:hypothetical protein
LLILRRFRAGKQFRQRQFESGQDLAARQRAVAVNHGRLFRLSVNSGRAGLGIDDPDELHAASPDPLEFGGGQTNLAEYCGNSPANFTDPSGMDPVYAPLPPPPFDVPLPTPSDELNAIASARPLPDPPELPPPGNPLTAFGSGLAAESSPGAVGIDWSDSGGHTPERSDASQSDYLALSYNYSPQSEFNPLEPPPLPPEPSPIVKQLPINGVDGKYGYYGVDSDGKKWIDGQKVEEITPIGSQWFGGVDYVVTFADGSTRTILGGGPNSLVQVAEAGIMLGAPYSAKPPPRGEP